MIDNYSDEDKNQYFLLRAIEIGQLGQFIFSHFGCILLLFINKIPIYLIVVIFILMKFLWYPFANKITNYKFAIILPYIGIVGLLTCISVAIYLFIFVHEPVLGICALLWKWVFPIFGLVATLIIRIKPPQYGVIQNNLIYDYKNKVR